MSILIGGSPSTGSSLLRRMLNRHTEIFCGSETSLFAKTELFTDWEEYKVRLFRPSHFGLSNAGWHNFIGLEIDEEYQWTRKEMRQLIKTHFDFPSFVNSFYKPILEREGKCFWAEKTPSNAFTLKVFLDTFGDGKIIHTVRHPLDIIASLVNRGKSVYDATALCLLNMSKALLCESDPRYFLLKYEDLVTQPEETLVNLCDFLNILYEENMLEPQSSETGVTQMKGWKSDETDKPSTSSIGRFQELSMSERSKILKYAKYLKGHVNKELDTIAKLALHLGYPFPELNKIDEPIDDITSDMKNDLKARQFSRFYFRKYNYPLSIIDAQVS